MLRATLLALGLLPFLTAQAGWIETNEVLRQKSVKPKLCSELAVSNETDVSVDSETCLNEAQFLVLQKYITEHEGRNVITLMRLKIQVKNIQCDGKIKKVFGHYFVNHRGEVIYKKPGFEVTYVDNCELVTNIQVLNSSPEDDNVKRLKRSQYYKLPFKIRKNIESLDLSIELDREVDILNIKRFKVIDPALPELNLGYILVYTLEDLLSEEKFETLVRFDSMGNWIGEIDYD